MTDKSSGERGKDESPAADIAKAAGEAVAATGEMMSKTMGAAADASVSMVEAVDPIKHHEREDRDADDESEKKH